MAGSSQSLDRKAATPDRLGWSSGILAARQWRALTVFQAGPGDACDACPLTYTESLAYIRHRLLQVGACADTVFTAEAVGKIARYARGNPRVMNVLCTNLLITGFLARQNPFLSLWRATLLLPIEQKTPRCCGGEVWHMLREFS